MLVYSRLYLYTVATSLIQIYTFTSRPEEKQRCLFHWGAVRSVSISARTWTPAVSSHSPGGAHRDVNSSPPPQVHQHSAAIQPLKTTGLMASNGPPSLPVKCWSVVVPHVP